VSKDRIYVKKVVGLCLCGRESYLLPFGAFLFDIALDALKQTIALPGEKKNYYFP
jgi:hypothetical protein